MGIFKIPKVKRVIKTFVANGGKKGGLSRLMGFRRRVIILCYHRIIPKEEIEHTLSSKWIIVNLASFERQMQLLRTHFDPISAEKFNAIVQGKETFPRRSVLVTFDDGWEDNYQYAFPILQRYNIPAIIFLTTGFIGTQKVFWPERLFYYLRRLEKENAETKKGIQLINTALQLDISTNDLRQSDLADRIVEKAKWIKHETRERLFNELAHLFPEMDENIIASNHLLSWDQVSEMYQKGIAFGSHGVTHRLLTNLDPSEIRWEAMESRRTIETHLGISPKGFAYPNGNYSPDVIQAVKEEGFQWAVTTEKGSVGSSQDPFRLPRLCLDDLSLSDWKGKFSEAIFLSRLAGYL